MSHQDDVKKIEQPRVKKKTSNLEKHESESSLIYKFYIKMMVINSF